MQNEMNKIFETTQETLNKESEFSKQTVQRSAQRLLEIKQQNNPSAESTTTETVDIDNWEIEYDE